MARNPTSTPRRVSQDAARRAFSLRIFGEVVSELRRVTWPSREETTRLMLMVLAISGAIGIFLGVIDIGFSRLVSLMLGN